MPAYKAEMNNGLGFTASITTGKQKQLTIRKPTSSREVFEELRTKREQNHVEFVEVRAISTTTTT